MCPLSVFWFFALVVVVLVWVLALSGRFCERPAGFFESFVPAKQPTRYMLDTNISSYVIKGNIPRVRERLLKVPMAQVSI
jgi:hypothetical protein